MDLPVDVPVTIDGMMRGESRGASCVTSDVVRLVKCDQ